MFERFTERARQVIVLAQDEARGLKHGHIGSEHLLLGLLREQEGLAARVLESVGATVDEARAVAAGMTTPSAEPATGQIPLTPRAKKILEVSLREALSLGHNYIGTEHILLGLVRELGGVPVSPKEFVDVSLIRERTLELLHGRAETKEPSERLNLSTRHLLEQGIVDSHRALASLRRTIQGKEHDVAIDRADARVLEGRIAELQETLGESYSSSMCQRVMERP